MNLLILKLILAHLIGDFFLQPKKWVKDKDKKMLRSKWLYIHVAIHFVLMLILVWNVAYVPLILGISVLHLIIDGVKVTLQNKNNKRLLFFTDQAFHIVTILIGVAFFTEWDVPISISFGTKELLLVVCIVLLTQPTSIIMKTIFSKWEISKITKGNESLKDAGKYIGILERLLVFTFIIVGQWAAVGFLITAKSVFRFGDLTASKERQLTEYILIGTLISFGMAIMVSLLYIYLKHYV